LNTYSPSIEKIRECVEKYNRLPGAKQIKESVLSIVLGVVDNIESFLRAEKILPDVIDVYMPEDGVVRVDVGKKKQWINISLDMRGCVIRLHKSGEEMGEFYFTSGDLLDRKTKGLRSNWEWIKEHLGALLK
jgi:hypothetical protein